MQAVFPELPHSSQWQEGDPVTPDNAGTIPPGTAIATFENGRYGNAATGNHAAIFLGPHYNVDGLRDGIDVVDQSERFQAQERAFSVRNNGAWISRRRVFRHSQIIFARKVAGIVDHRQFKYRAPLALLLALFSCIPALARIVECLAVWPGDSSKSSPHVQ
ncbi:MAG: BPSL0067 family protein [Methylocella sp.]